MKATKYKLASNVRLDKPHGNVKIWRYIGLDKFLDLITSKELHFSNISRLTDEYEARVPEKTAEKERRRYKHAGLDERDASEEIARQFLDYEFLRKLSFVNCWSIGRDESYALWKIYLEGAKAGVAIQTTVANLERSIEIANGGATQKSLYIGQVKYDHFIHPKKVSRFSLICSKPPFYDYEREVRLFVMDYHKSEGGTGDRRDRRVSVDLDQLVRKIYVSPFAGDWFGGVILNTVQRLCPQLKDRIIKSGVRDS